jgi:lipoate-protein ligase A
LPWETADGPTNMAADDVLVRSATDRRVASLRFYGWTPATLSLGYFQPAASRLADPRLAALPFVRRPSGGATLVHHHEVTYALTVPPGRDWHAGDPWLPRMHRIIAAALARLGLAGRVGAVDSGAAVRHSDVLCFQQLMPDDLLCGGAKVVGSAQRKYHRALLQHGSILLARSEHTPALPGLRELTGADLTSEAVRTAVVDELTAATGWRIVLENWTEEERAAVAQLVEQQYGTATWNEKR